MIKLERILCPTNLSKESDEAMRYGVALANRYKAKLFLLFCGDTAQASNGSHSGTRRHVKGLFEESLARYLGPSKFNELDWEGNVVEHCEDTGEAIVRQAAELGTDLIIMRSRRRPRAAALLGSTAERVYRTAPCPVLVTHPLEREWVSGVTGEIDLHRILVAHDFSTDSELALNYAVLLAQEYQAELHLMHVLSSPETDGPEIAWGPGAVEGTYHDAARRLHMAVPAEAHLWSNVSHSVRWGKPYQEVLSFASEQKIDLICMGAKGRNFTMGALFGSNVDRVLRQAPCPILVARPLKPSMSAVLREAS